MILAYMQRVWSSEDPDSLLHFLKNFMTLRFGTPAFQIRGVCLNFSICATEASTRCMFETILGIEMIRP